MRNDFLYFNVCNLTKVQRVEIFLEGFLTNFGQKILIVNGGHGQCCGSAKTH